MSKTDPRVLAELDGEQRTDGQTPPAGPDPEVVDRMADAINRKAAIDHDYYDLPFVDNVDELARQALDTIRPGDALGNGLVAMREDAVDAAVKAEREACAAVAEAHKGAAKRKREAAWLKTGKRPRSDMLESILAEENGEDIASHEIATAIRARVA